MKAGRSIVTVNSKSRPEDTLRIIRQLGGYDRTNARHTQHAATMDRRVDSGQTVRAYQEQLHVQKTPQETGEARIRKEVHTEHKKLDVPVMREEVVIERRPASGQEVAAQDINAGQEIRVP